MRLYFKNKFVAYPPRCLDGNDGLMQIYKTLRISLLLNLILKYDLTKSYKSISVNEADNLAYYYYCDNIVIFPLYQLVPNSHNIMQMISKRYEITQLGSLPH